MKLIGCPDCVFVLVSSWIGWGLIGAPGAKVVPSQRSERRSLASSLTISMTWSEYGLELSVIERDTLLPKLPKLVPADQGPVPLKVRYCSSVVLVLSLF